LMLNCEGHSSTWSCGRLSKRTSGSHVMTRVWSQSIANVGEGSVAALNSPRQHSLYGIHTCCIEQYLVSKWVQDQVGSCWYCSILLCPIWETHCTNSKEKELCRFFLYVDPPINWSLCTSGWEELLEHIVYLTCRTQTLLVKICFFPS
jgi:hypothetical protein